VSAAEEVVTLSYDDAVALLPGGEEVHTFLDGGVALIGADWDRDAVLALLRDGSPELSGPAAAGIGHGIVAFRNGDRRQPVFVATKRDEP
jgi:hypothetical protein